MSKLIHIDSEYKQWIQELKSCYRRSQIKASVHVNREMLAFYWELGRDIVRLDAEQRWGSGFMRLLSQDLKQELPDAAGITLSNLYYCKKFYSLYNEESIKIPQVVGKLETLLSAVPWGHHRYNMDKCGEDTARALFYVRQTLENGWSCYDVR